MIAPVIKRDHDDLHEGLDRDVRRRCGGAFLLCLCGRMDAHVSGQFIRAREPLLAGREGALMRAFASMGPDVASLVLETMKGLCAEVAFVRARSVLATPGGGGWRLGCGDKVRSHDDGHVYAAVGCGREGE